MCWCIAEPLYVFLSGFPKQLRIVISCDVRLNKGVDVTELAPKPNVDRIRTPSRQAAKIAKEHFCKSWRRCARQFTFDATVWACSMHLG